MSAQGNTETPLEAALKIRHIGMQDYQHSWQRMRGFSRERTPTTADELWVLEHAPVFTQGRAGKAEHVLAPGEIPIVKTDRGGQVTYHGPGQIILYVLIDLHRRKLGIKHLVAAIEQAVIKTLADENIVAGLQAGAPGVYVNGRKIASLGLRVTHGCTYHGVSLNYDMDLSPFSRINPCGYQGLEVTQMVELGVKQSRASIEAKLCHYLTGELGYNTALIRWPEELRQQIEQTGEQVVT